jgi:cysteine desulfurase
LKILSRALASMLLEGKRRYLPEAATHWVYLDNAATTRTDPAVVAAMLPFFTQSFGNPSSSHDFGRAAAAAVTAARREVQALIGAASEDEIVFTAGATEANNAALRQSLRRESRNEVVVSAVEHPAVLAVAADLEKHHGVVVHRIGVDGFGRLDLAAYRRALSRRTALVSIMWANNETGTVFPVPDLAAMAHAVGALFHTDAVQAAGKLAIDVGAGTIDLLSLSAHKLHGPKGIGALYVRKGTKFRALLRGGRQERSRRAGTENVPGIVGFGAAAALARERMEADAGHIAHLRDRLERAITATIDGSFILGDRHARVPATSCIAFDGADGEELLHRLNQAGIAASAGSACTAGAMEPSHVVRAMAVPYTAAHGVLRFSLSRETGDDDIARVMTVLPAIVAQARQGSLFAARPAAE